MKCKFRRKKEAGDMNTLEALIADRASPGSQASADRSSYTREGLALVLLDRVATAEGYSADDARRYLLDLLREILLTIDGKRTPPIVVPVNERRVGSIDRRESPAA
jgi:hypothetical protein